jgi:hypothetical protein
VGPCDVEIPLERKDYTEVWPFLFRKVQVENPVAKAATMSGPEPEVRGSSPCRLCPGLMACTEEVPMQQLEQSVRAGCPTCSFFWQTCSVAADISTLESVSTWSTGGAFGVCLEHSANEAGGPATHPGTSSIAVIAANGGKMK